MTQAVTALNDWVFAETPLTEIVVYNVASNEGSRRVKQKTGASTSTPSFRTTTPVSASRRSGESTRIPPGAWKADSAQRRHQKASERTQLAGSR